MLPCVQLLLLALAMRLSPCEVLVYNVSSEGLYYYHWKCQRLMPNSVKYLPSILCGV